MFAGWRAALFTGNPELGKRMGLTPGALLVIGQHSFAVQIELPGGEIIPVTGEATALESSCP